MGIEGCQEAAFFVKRNVQIPRLRANQAEILLLVPVGCHQLFYYTIDSVSDSDSTVFQ